MSILSRIEQISKYQKAKRFLEKYERLLMPGALIVGVLIDFVTFKNLQVGTAFLILIGHFVLGGIAIFVLNKQQSKLYLGIDAFRYLKLVAPIVIQFTFGAMLSASLIFYWFSGTLSASWPLLVIVAFLMASNDVFRQHFLKPGVQLSVYYFIVFSLLTLMLPYLFNSIGIWVFILGGVVSLVVISMLLEFLSKHDLALELKQAVKKSVIVIFVLMNVLYFFNIIPPIPLSIRDAGVYHHVARAGGSYQLQKETASFFESIIPGQTIHTTKYDPVYLFSSIFAPAKLNTKIVHHWQYYDEEFEIWTDQGELSYNISGGREDGYRGYSRKANLMEGKWRVDIQTKRGQTLGRIQFKVKHVDEKPKLEQISK